jgi:hypothetical protein
VRSRRQFLVFAAVWDLAAGTLLLLLPEGRGGIGPVTPTRRARASGWVVVVFGLLFGALAVRPTRPLVLAGAVAKGVGAASGVVGAAAGRRDAVTLVGLADAAWIPGLLRAARLP